MRLITESSELTEAFEDLITHYDNFYCCVAWAGAPKSFKAGRLLLKHSSKIKKAIVGLHFYQTHPEFISTFIDNESIRFFMETHGVFHDKIYRCSGVIPWQSYPKMIDKRYMKNGRSDTPCS